MIKNKIVVIDSGLSHKYIENCSIKLYIGKNFFDENCNVIEDKIGHGTSIINIIYSLAPNSEFIVLKIYDTSLEQNIDVFIDALKYIYTMKIQNSLIHMSVGIDFYYEELYSICLKLARNNNILISAFDNAGCISYPAAFDCVIGVEGNASCRRINDFIINSNNIIDVYAKGGNHRVLDNDCAPIIRQGNSYSAAFVTGFLAKKSINDYSKENALKELSNFTTFSYKINESENNYFDSRFKLSDLEKSFIKRIGVFPYNKEIKTMVRYADYLQYKLSNIYSCKYLKNIGKEIYDKNQCKSYVIKDIDDISRNDIDTLIIGHISQIQYYVPDIKNQILSKCIQQHINVYSLDTYLIDKYITKFNQNALMIRCPIIKINDIKKNGKLYQISIPIVLVVGTSSNQGKFSLQIELKKQFENNKYEVGFLASEPTGELFGADQVIPYGYNGIRNISDYEFIDLINTQLHEIELLGKEIIITGAQSRAVPQSAMHLGTMALRQLEYILAIQPDVVLLCINYDDDIEYVCRAINTIENLVNTKMLGFVLFTEKYKNAWTKQKERMERISNSDLAEAKKMFQEKTKIKVYIAGQEEKEICEALIEYF